ncbi:unnamed protein product [Brassica oleracea]
MRYWVLGLVLSPGKAFPGEVDRCLTGSRGMIHAPCISNRDQPLFMEEKEGDGTGVIYRKVQAKTW